MIKWHFTPNLYSKAEVNEINRIAQTFIDETYKDRPGAGKQADVKVARFEGELQDALSRMTRVVNQLNEEYFGFDIFNHVPYSLNYNSYREGDAYNFHMDASSPDAANDVKLTAVLNVSSEPFVGGEFEFFLNGELARIKEMDDAGTLLVFPSPLFHRVKPVQMGCRKTISVWYTGPKWR